MLSEFGRVAVLYGGDSAEREVSLKSGNAVHAALVRAGVDAHLLDFRKDTVKTLLTGTYDRVFIALHGRGGEDGTLQGLLEMLGIPYTGSGVLASALAMDKSRTKRLWQAEHLPTPDFITVNGADYDFDIVANAAAAMGYPLSVKPSHEGSSIGVYRVESESELKKAIASAGLHDGELLVEKWVIGKEFTVAVLDDMALPAIGLSTDHTFYDFDAKYLSNDTRYLLPCGLSAAAEQEMQALAEKAFKVLGCRGWARIDVMQDEDGNFWLLEANTVPGMTDHSLVPMAAKAAGIEFEELVVRILKETI